MSNRRMEIAGQAPIEIITNSVDVRAARIGLKLSCKAGVNVHEAIPGQPVRRSIFSAERSLTRCTYNSGSSFRAILGYVLFVAAQS